MAYSESWLDDFAECKREGKDHEHKRGSMLETLLVMIDVISFIIAGAAAVSSSGALRQTAALIIDKFILMIFAALEEAFPKI